MKLEKIVFTPDPGAWKHFTTAPDGAIGSDIRRRGRHLQFLARRSVQKDTGKLARSINMQYFAVKNPWVRVGSEDREALMMHNGTRPHVITPNNQQVLRFKVKGKIVYTRRVLHPGTRGSFYLSRHLRKVIQ